MCDGKLPAAMFCNDWGEIYPKYEDQYPAGWFKSVPEMFKHYHKEQCIDDRDSIKTADMHANGGSDWNGVFLFQRKPEY
jgi:hypothetical protein